MNIKSVDLSLVNYVLNILEILAQEYRHFTKPEKKYTKD